MISEKQKKNLKKYRHLVAAMISYSYGYFTPPMALEAIQDHKNHKPSFCEWYFDIACRRGVKSDADYIQINHDTIKGAIRCRHLDDFKRSLVIVDKNIESHESIGASWF